MATPGMPSSVERTADSGRRVPARLPRAQRVGDIEAAARLVFSRKGFAAASIAEIAAEAGVAEGTIYKFFESKRQLFVRVLEGWYDAMLTEFERNLPGIVGCRNKIRFIIWRHIASLSENKDLARVCVNEARNSKDYFQSELYDLNRRYTHVFLEACREGMVTGELHPDTPIALLRDLVFGGIEHHIYPVLYGEGDIDPEQSADLIYNTVFAGISDNGLEATVHHAAITRLERVALRLETAALRIEGKS